MKKHFYPNHNCTVLLLKTCFYHMKPKIQVEIHVTSGLIAQSYDNSVNTLRLFYLNLINKAEDCDIPVFDTTLIHATAVVKFALS